ncbi:MAG: hypothetical protein ACLFTN_14185, partial [Phycisphaerae bacterium]
WLMLAVIVLQGTGLMHSLHLGLEHAPCGCLASESASACHSGDLYENPGPSVCKDAVHASTHRHSHSPGTCPICQSLGVLKAATDAQDAGLFFILPPPLQSTATESFSLPQIALTTLGPRAPPVC